MVTIGHVMELQSRRQTLQSLVQSGSIGEDVWKSFLAAEEFVGEEIQTIVAEADSLKPGWGQHIMPQAQQLLQAELEKHAAAEHLENEQLQKRREEERKIREEIDAKEKRIKAEQAAKELLLEEEREKLMQSQRQRKSSSSKS